jgi:transposase
MLTPEERQAVEALTRSRTAEARTVARAKIILAADDGLGPSAAAVRLGTSRPTISTWIKRFNAQGPYGLQDQPRAGRPATCSGG